jgi:uncharacterized membrane protein YdjX (TVP38/TMEM64 family)
MEQDRRRGAGGVPVRRFVPLGLLLLGLALFFLLRLDRYLNYEALRENRAALQQFVAERRFAALLGYGLVYALVTALSLPVGAILTIAGGFLFGPVVGTVVTVIGATLGATAIFLAARTSLGAVLTAKAGPFLHKMERGFSDNALSYLLVLRLVPLFPFWLVNLVPAVLGVPLGIYVAGTFLGIIPGTFVYALVGGGLGELLAAGERPRLDIIFRWDILLALLGLALLALVPVVYKKLKAR